MEVQQIMHAYDDIIITTLRGVQNPKLNLINKYLCNYFKLFI